MKRHNQGQTTVEYLLIIALLTVLISFLGKGLKDKIPETVNTIFASLPTQVLAQAQNNN